MSPLRGSLVVALFHLGSYGFGQVAGSSPQTTAPPTPAKVEMPTDPAALLELAAKKNGLQNAGAEPLHIKATYQLLDDKGGVKETGTIDEIRVSEEKYKLTYASPSFNQTDYSTEAGLFRVGDQNWPVAPLFAAYNSFYPRFPSETTISKSTLKMKPMKLGTADLQCATLDGSKETELFAYVNAYCFTVDSPILRLLETYHGTGQSLYNSVAHINGASLAQDVTYLELGKPQVRIHLDGVNSISHVDDATFSYPPDALKIPRRVTVDPSEAKNKLRHKVAPEYPGIARAGHIQGTVVIQVLVGRDGKVATTRLLGGPAMLQQAALDAVKQWEFEPFSERGESEEVGLELNVSFRLSGNTILPLAFQW